MRSLYKGFIPPLLGVGFEKALVFGIYTNIIKYLKDRKYNETYVNPIAGGISGFGASFIVTPIERIKILLQNRSDNILANCQVKYLFRGLTATFTRETPGFAIYFSVYESLKKKFYYKENITTHGSFIFGGISGAVSWLFIYPQDCVKTCMQSDKYQQYSFSKTVKNIYCEGGFIRFYKGFHFALMRAIPLHAGTFMTMELLKK
jgi:solute carrier family 25 carnitine/acylcarnitine transporter 20/29